MTLVVVAEDMNFATCGFGAGNLNWFETAVFILQLLASMCNDKVEVRTKLVD